MIIIHSCPQNNICSFLTPVFQTLISTAIIALCAWFVKGRITKYLADTGRMKKYGIRSIYARDGKFTNADLDTIFYKATSIKIFYTSGYRFWNRILKDNRLAKASKKNPNLAIEVILANPDSEFIKNVSSWEREENKRPTNELDLNIEIERVINILTPYSKQIDVRIDSCYYFLPYMIAEFEDKFVVHWNLTIPPFRAHTSLKVVGEQKKTSTRENMTSYFCNHFEHSWNEATPVDIFLNQRKKSI